MQLPSAWRVFVVQFLHEFQRKFIDFSVLFHAITIGVSIFSCFYFCSNLDEKSSILVCFFMQLPSAWCFFWFNFCSNFDENALIFDFVWISTKNHRFRRVFWCNYLRRVDSLSLDFGSNCDEKLSIFACLLMLLPAACRFFKIFTLNVKFTFRVVATWWNFCSGMMLLKILLAVRISTKNHRFWCAFRCNYLRRVNLFVARTRELLFGPACQRGLRTRRYGR